jgi:hypothetical protein
MSNTKPKEKADPKSSGAAKPVSLSPLSFEESIDSIFAVPPPPKDAPTPKTHAKKPAKKRR